MHLPNWLAREHLELTRRYFLQAGVAAAGLGLAPSSLIRAWADETAGDRTGGEGKYLTPDERFGTVERGNPLREAIWLARPAANIRRVFYYGHHNDDPEQLFQSSLSINRVLEDPPGELPVLLCYKLNGQWLSGKRGGPARIVVPEAYGFK